MAAKGGNLSDSRRKRRTKPKELGQNLLGRVEIGCQEEEKVRVEVRCEYASL